MRRIRKIFTSLMLILALCTTLAVSASAAINLDDYQKVYDDHELQMYWTGKYEKCNSSKYGDGIELELIIVNNSDVAVDDTYSWNRYAYINGWQTDTIFDFGKVASHKKAKTTIQIFFGEYVDDISEISNLSWNWKWDYEAFTGWYCEAECQFIFEDGESDVVASTTPTEKTPAFSVEVKKNGWTANTGLNGQTLYCPELQLAITNEQEKSASSVKVKVVFYNEAEKTVWSDETTYVVSSGDTPLKTGYSKTAFITSSVGYTSKPSASQLADVTAEVYINGELYTTLTIVKHFG